MMENQRTLNSRDLFNWTGQTENEPRQSGFRSNLLRLEVVGDFLLIMGLSFLISLIFNSLNPHGIDLLPVNWSGNQFHQIDVFEAKLRYDAGVLFVDARPNEDYRRKHINGAVNLPANLFDFTYQMKFGQIEHEKEIIIYGRNYSKLYDEEVASKLYSRGHPNIKILPGGLSGWQEGANPCTP